MRAPWHRPAARTKRKTAEHLESIDALRAEARTLATAPHAERGPLALRLYRHLALFVAGNFQHMHFEETHNNAALWASYGDAELLEIHQRIVGSLPLDETLVVARWMVPAVTPAERVQIVGAMKAAPPAVFQAIVDAFRPQLDDGAWGALARAIGVPQQTRPPARCASKAAWPMRTAATAGAAPRRHPS